MASLIRGMLAGGRKCGRYCKLPPLFKVLCSLSPTERTSKNFPKRSVKGKSNSTSESTGEKQNVSEQMRVPVHRFQDQLYWKTGIGSLLNIPVGVKQREI